MILVLEIVEDSVLLEWKTQRKQPKQLTALTALMLMARESQLKRFLQISTQINTKQLQLQVISNLLSSIHLNINPFSVHVQNALNSRNNHHFEFFHSRLQFQHFDYQPSTLSAIINFSTFLKFVLTKMGNPQSMSNSVIIG